MIDKLMLKNAIRLLIGGYIFDNSGEITEIPSLLEELANDYKEAIKKIK